MIASIDEPVLLDDVSRTAEEQARIVDVLRSCTACCARQLRDGRCNKCLALCSASRGKEQPMFDQRGQQVQTQHNQGSRSQQVPSVGRMVHYGALVGGNSDLVCRAAVITAVHEDGTVSLLVHHPLYDERLERIEEGPGPGRFHFPEFVPPKNEPDR